MPHPPSPVLSLAYLATLRTLFSVAAAQGYRTAVGGPTVIYKHRESESELSRSAQSTRVRDAVSGSDRATRPNGSLRQIPLASRPYVHTRLGARAFGEANLYLSRRNSRFRYQQRLTTCGCRLAVFSVLAAANLFVVLTALVLKQFKLYIG
ncbi:hypothetical protein J6590_023101 [Homalodisca vitripennis]|nr:hypothetical protein J6590_023101 [Homalodisca vitripennis]